METETEQAPQASPVLSLQGVRLYYSRSRKLRNTDKHYVLEDVNLDLFAGQTLGIVGRNGAGKSSLLKVLAGVLAPDVGRLVKHKPDLQVSLLTLQLGFQAQLTGRVASRCRRWLARRHSPLHASP